MKLDSFWFALKRDFDIIRTRLIGEADLALYNDDRTRCLNAISQIYNLLDEEFGSA